MTNKQMALLIPQEYRQEIIELDIIYRAVADVDNDPMKYLCNVWKDYIEPSFSPSCNRCLIKVLKAFKQMRDVFVEIEKQNKLLDAL